MNRTHKNCKAIGADLALHASSDLPVERTRIVEDHLRHCAQCRQRLQALVGDIEATQAFATACREEERLARVRHDVLEQIRSGSIRLPARKALRPALAAACALAVAVALWIASVYGPPPIAEQAPAPTGALVTQSSVIEPEATAPALIAEQSTLRAPPSAEYEWKQDPVLVKLYIDDPDMVIIWLGD